MFARWGKKCRDAPCGRLYIVPEVCCRRCVAGGALPEARCQTPASQTPASQTPTSQTPASQTPARGVSTLCRMAARGVWPVPSFPGSFNSPLRIDELGEKPHHLILLLDMWRVPVIGQSDLTIRPAVRPVAFQNCANLRLHWLRRVSLRAGPAGNGTQLPEKTEIEERGIRDDLIVAAMYP